MIATIEIERKNLSYTYDADGYMLTYKGRPIGGAGVKLPREKPLHWKHARANRHDNQQSAEREIAALIAGNGQGRFLEVITRIDAEQSYETEQEVCCHRVAIRYWGFTAKLTRDLRRDLTREGRQRAKHLIGQGYRSGDLNCLCGDEEIRGWWEIIT
jgi:hypothetical protein